MAEVSTLSASVLCAHPVADIYNFQHRFVHYIALAYLLLSPVTHRWLTPAALSMVAPFTVISTVFAARGLFFTDRPGPALDVFPIQGILLINTSAFIAFIVCRRRTIEVWRPWSNLFKIHHLLHPGFLLANSERKNMVKMIKIIRKTVNCASETSTALSANVFSVGNGLACDNPCISSSPGFVPILWGSIDPVTRKFTELRDTDIPPAVARLVCLASAAIMMTVAINYYWNMRITRNTVFAMVGRKHTSSRARIAVAKTVAVFWFGWSCLAMLAVALAPPVVIWALEEYLKLFPTANSTCFVKQWAAWIVCSALAVFKVCVVTPKMREAAERRIETEMDMKEFELKAKNLLRRMEENTKKLKIIVAEKRNMEMTEPDQAEYSLLDNFVEFRTSRKNLNTTEIKTPGDAEARVGEQHLISVSAVRETNGLLDMFAELREWWDNPTGAIEERDSLKNKDGQEE